MNCEFHPFDILSTINGKPEPYEVSLDDVQKAVATVDSTCCMTPTDDRMKALNVLKAALDRITPMDYVMTFFDKLEQPNLHKLTEIYRKFPAFYWYDISFEKVLNGIQNTAVAPGETLLWHVYNMGYIVKTSTQCFAIDLHHRRSLELLPYLDFCIVTHNHDDHYSSQFLHAMNHAHKPIISNFSPNDGYNATDGEAGFSIEPQRTLKLGDITIHTYQSDHNPKLRKFMMPAEIVCGDTQDSCVIFTSGDTAYEQQLHRTSDKIDFYIVHPYCHLNPVGAADILQPKCTLVSHLEELHHAVDCWRWTWRQGYDAAQQLWNAGYDAVVPLWGDAIVWHP